MTGDKRQEQGSRDYRLLPAAVAVWGSMLVANRLFAILVEGEPALSAFGVQGITGAMLWPLIAVIAVCGFLAGRRTAIRHMRASCLAPDSRIMAMVVIAAVAVGMASSWAWMSMQWHDPAAAAARDGKASVVAVGTIAEPLKTSTVRDADCQVEVDLDAILIRDIEKQSVARIRVFADRQSCGRMLRGATYRMTGSLSEAEYGATALWLRLESGQSVECIRPPSVFERVRARLQERFFAAVSRLSDQGRVLVPGLTMGVLGQDHVPSDGQWVDGLVNETYAARMEDSFRNAGIMHLMAVSGGHFVLIAGLVRRLCAGLLLPRGVTACGIAISYALLASLMAPGDSVLRALCMGWLGALSLAVGRRTQALSALCCTVIGALLVCPSLATSYGFALSCAAVLGIVILSSPMTVALAKIMPKPVAAALAMTVAAQSTTLPIQVLMEPQLPLLSCLANLLVAPVVSYATLLGLAALACAWISVDAAFVLAWLASGGTRVMEVVAQSLGDAEYSVLPWESGAVGALLVVLLELSVGFAVIYVTRWAKRRRTDDGYAVGRFGRNPKNGLEIWISDTLRLFGGDSWSS